MDEFSGKRGAGGLMAPKKGYNVTFKDGTIDRDKNTQSCNRIGCSGRIKYGQSTTIGTSAKANCGKSSFGSSNGNEIIGSSSRTSSVLTRRKTALQDSKRKFTPQLDVDSLESSQSRELEAAALEPLPSRIPAGDDVESKNKYGEDRVKNFKSSRALSVVRPWHRLGLRNQNSPPASSVQSASRSSGSGTVNSSDGSRYRLMNLKCTSIKDVALASSSSSQSKSVPRSVMKRNPEGESSSSSTGRKTTVSLSIDRHVAPSSTGIPICGSGRSRSAAGEDSIGATSVGRQRLMNVSNSRMGPSFPDNRRNNLSVREHAGRPSSPQHLSESDSPNSSSSYDLFISDDVDRSPMMPFMLAELDFTHLMNHERHNMDGITEVLLAIERIEQDVELTNEQALAFETSLYLSGLNLFDQHRDMRLDIDNMSYEELLDLEERMGTVSTALSEEALLKCLTRSIYQVAPSEERVAGSTLDGDDINCSICQEEYVLGDEIGKLVGCQHGYHAACIDQWLRVKNWCPVCKAAAAAAAPQQ